MLKCKYCGELAYDEATGIWNRVYIEYLGVYDGALTVKCLSCGKEEGRFSGKEITENYTIQDERAYLYGGKDE